MLKNNIKKNLRQSWSLLIILIGIVFIWISVGPFQNADTQWEFHAASGVLRWGIPYVISCGNIMNQPPLGFYIEALFLNCLGLSIDNGVILVSLFGLGSFFLIYKIGDVLYDKLTGLFAAVLFALSPWEIVLSRSFLIDSQCLFFSLFSLLLGIWAMRRNSLKLFMVSGTFFGAAFMTKFFAVFTLIPILLFYVYYGYKNLRRSITWLFIF